MRNDSKKAGPGRGRRGFTVLELLIAIGIIALLTSVGIPALKGLNHANHMDSARRQLLDDLSYARQKAMNERTTVYVVFVPPGVGKARGSLAALNELRSLTNVLGSQLAGYALFARRSIGDQPGRENPRFLTDWKRLPEQVFISAYKFKDDFADTAKFNGADANVYGRKFAYAAFPFPLAHSAAQSLPYVAFNAQGKLVYIGADGRAHEDRNDEIIPLARGSLMVPRDGAGNYAAHLPVNAQETPPGNHTNNYVRVNHLTGRAKVEKTDFK